MQGVLPRSQPLLRKVKLIFINLFLIIVIIIFITIVINIISDEQETDHDGHQHVLHHNGQHDGGGPLHRSCPQNLERTFAALCNIIFQVEYLKLKLQNCITYETGVS